MCDEQDKQFAADEAKLKKWLEESGSHVDNWQPIQWHEGTAVLLQEPFEHYVYQHGLPDQPRYAWYSHPRLPLKPQLHIKRRDEWNAFQFHLRWLCFHIHTLDEPELGLHLELSARAIQCYITIPYLRLRLDIPLPAVIERFMYKRLSRYPRKW